MMLMLCCRRVLASVAVVTLALGLLAPVARAEEGTRFGLQPVGSDATAPTTRPYFVFEAKPGGIVQSAVRVINMGSVAGRVRLYGVDAATGQTSGTVFLLRHDPRREVGAWLTLGTEELTLEPGESSVVPFRLAIPAGAYPGEHVGGIVAEDAELKRSGGEGASGNAAGFQIIIQNRTATAVELNLGGPFEEQLEITGISAGGQQGYQTLVVGMRNSGTVRLKPSGSLQVRDERGQVVQDLKLKLDTILPRAAISFPVFVQDRALAAGEYEASVVLTYGNNREARYTGRFTITPLQIAQVFGSQKPLAPPVPQADAVAASPTSLSPLLLVALGAGGMLALVFAAKLARRACRRRFRPEPSSSARSPDASAVALADPPDHRGSPVE